jgi:phosphoglycerate dehydrogenase-like enzyme
MTIRSSLVNMTTISTLLCTKAVSPAAVDKMRKAVEHVHYYPDNKPIPSDVLSSAEVLFTGGGKFASSIKSLKNLPKLRHIQMASAGANGMIATPQMQEYIKGKDAQGGGREITLAGASGTHVLSIPNYVVACVIMLYHQLHTQIIASRVSCAAIWCVKLTVDRGQVERGR